MTVIQLENGDTPESVFNDGDLLFKIQLKNRIEKLIAAADETAALILEDTPYGKRILVKIIGPFDAGYGEVWAKQFISAVKEYSEFNRN